MASHTPIPPPEKYFVAFVIQGEDVFKITSESIVHTCGNSGEQAFQGIAKLRAAAALEQLTAIHNERPDELLRWLVRWRARAWPCWRVPAIMQKPILKESRKLVT